MDPTAVVGMILHHHALHEVGETEEYLGYLEEWLVKGGFVPENIMDLYWAQLDLTGLPKTAWAVQGAMNVERMARYE